jgi:hypothetical protein
MRTDDLIRAMAVDAAPKRPVWIGLTGGLVAAALTVGLVGLSLVGMRPDLGAALQQAAVLLKLVFPWVLAAGAFGAALRLARPGAVVGGWALLVVIVVLIVAAGIVAQMMVMPKDAWFQAFMGSTRRFCLAYISMMAAPLLAVVLLGLRRGASTRPGVSGAVAGLLAGSVAAGIYAMHCTEDSPLFYGAWYGLAILIATGAGALAGRRVLRW